MITILHGDNIALSRDAFYHLKNHSTHPVFLRGGEFSLTDLIQAFEGDELFEETKEVFIEEFFTKLGQKKQLAPYLEAVKKAEKDHSIIIWEGKTLTQAQLSTVPSAKIELFRMPTSIFTFLDNLAPGNKNRLITLSSQAISDSGEEMVFNLLTRHIRLLIALKENVLLDDLNRLSHWQKDKLRAQSSRFTLSSLLLLHRSLFQIDEKRKTGESTNSLTSSIDFLLVKI